MWVLDRVVVMNRSLLLIGGAVADGGNTVQSVYDWFIATSRRLRLTRKK